MGYDAKTFYIYESGVLRNVVHLPDIKPDKFAEVYISRIGTRMHDHTMGAKIILHFGDGTKIKTINSLKYNNIPKLFRDGVESYIKSEFKPKNDKGQTEITQFRKSKGKKKKCKSNRK